MAYQSPYARAAQSQDSRRFSIPRGIKSMLRSLKNGSGSRISSNKVSVGDLGTPSAADSRPHRTPPPAAGQASKPATRRSSGGRIRSDSINSTPPSSHLAQDRAGAPRHSRLSIRELIGAPEGKASSSNAVVSHPHVRQIEVKPSPDLVAVKKLVCDKVGPAPLLHLSIIF